MSVIDAAARFPLAAAVLEASSVAAAFRIAADELDSVANSAHEYEPGALRREICGIVLATVEAAITAEVTP